MAAEASHAPRVRERETFADRMRQFFAKIEPWYDWGKTATIWRLDQIEPNFADESVGEGYEIELQWFGAHIGFVFGRVPAKVSSSEVAQWKAIVREKATACHERAERRAIWDNALHLYEEFAHSFAAASDLLAEAEQAVDRDPSAANEQAYTAADANVSDLCKHLSIATLALAKIPAPDTDAALTKMQILIDGGMMESVCDDPAFREDLRRFSHYENQEG